MSKGVIWTLFLLFTLSISSCDNTDIAKTQGGLKTKCPVSDPLGLLEKTPECEANTDDPLNLIPSQSTEILVQNLATIAEAASVLEVCLLSEAYLQIDSRMPISFQ